MSYYCDICDETIKFKSKNNHLKTITHNELEKLFIHFILLTIQNFSMPMIYDIYNDFIYLHNEKFFFLVKCVFNLVFDSNFYPFIQSVLYTNKTICFWKKFLINANQDFINQGYKFSHISNMNIITNNFKLNMTYENNINQPMQAVERKLKMIIAKNPHLISSINRSHNHPLIRNYSHIPFNN